MARVVTGEEADELMTLWDRLERLKIGIGGWVITAASMPGYSPEAIEADDRIRAATGEALAVKARIAELTSPPPPPDGSSAERARHARPVERPAPRVVNVFTVPASAPDPGFAAAG